METIREEMQERLGNAFRKEFGKEPEGFISAPGRVELLGNHTDHQHGKVLAASVDLRAYAAFALNGTDRVQISSEGYAPIRVDLDDLMPDVSEFNSTRSIVRGVLNGFYQLQKKGAYPGKSLKGFDACIASEVLTGSGLSSSAAFEVLLGRIINRLFFEDEVSALQIAKIGQTAENRFFGKPCGLMDQAASSIGDVVFFDFRDAEDPSAEQIRFDFQEAGFALCAVACGGDHADLTGDYASIPKDMRAVAALFGKQVLRDLDEETVLSDRTRIVEALGERPFLRAVHYFEETRRAEAAADALRRNDIQKFLDLANDSGKSSRKNLANIIPASDPEEKHLDAAMRIAVELLGGKHADGSSGEGMKGAVRMNGGGFAGTFLSVVPLDMLDGFKQQIEEKLGKGSCLILNV